MKKMILLLVVMFGVNQSFADAYIEDVETNNNTGNNMNNVSKENMLNIELSTGPIVIELYPEKAPKHVARIKELAREGFYDGVTFHRVIDGFMAQTGDPTGTGTGSSDKPNLVAEFNDTKHERGVVSMARAQDPNSANSQFFIMFESATHLDGQYTAFGKVVKGIENVDKIKRGTGAGGVVEKPRDSIVTMKVMADAQ